MNAATFDWRYAPDLDLIGDIDLTPWEDATRAVAPLMTGKLADALEASFLGEITSLEAAITGALPSEL
mgnify:CR=1 FL=1